MADTKGLSYEEMKKANDEQEKAFLESDEWAEILDDLDLDD